MEDLIRRQPEITKRTAETEQNVPNSDLISRKAAIDLIRDVCDAILSQCGSHYDGDDEVYDNILEVDAVLKCNKEIRIALANMPSVQERKGRWNRVGDIDWECTACGGFSCCAGAYCPNCGAHMEGEQDDND